MTLPDIVTKARDKVYTDSTSYPDANLLIDINIWYQKIVSMIFESMDESDFDDARRTDYPIQTTPLVAGQRDYSIPVTEQVLKIKRVDITYDGTNWYRATPLDDGEYQQGMGNDTNTDQNFIKQAPRYDLKYNSIWVYPLATSTDVSSGASIRVTWDRDVIAFTSANLSDTSVIPGFDEPFHPFLAAGAAYERAVSRQLPQLAQLQTEVQDWEVRLRTHYSRRELDRNPTMVSAYDDYYGR